MPLDVLWQSIGDGFTENKERRSFQQQGVSRLNRVELTE
jgi:hypothetical protein